MRPRRVAYAIAFASGSVLFLASSDARAGDPAAAREQVKIGYQLAQEGKCEQALPHFVESLRLDAKAITLINLAQCEEKTGKLADALGHWVDARARAQAEGNVAIEAEAEKRAKALEPKLPKLTVTLAGAGAAPGVEVVRDGVVLGSVSMGVALPVNPGPHTLVVRAPDREDTTQNVTIAEGENKKVELKLGAAKKATAAAPAAPRGDRKESEAGGTSSLVYIGFGVALVGVGVGSVTGILAIGRGSDAKANCQDGLCKQQEDLDAAKGGQTLGTISTIGFIVGGVGAALGVYGLVWGKPKSSASVAVSVGPMGGGLRGTF
jgi:hypothetical protein